MFSLLVTSAVATIVPSADAARFKSYTQQFNKTYDNVEFADRMEIFRQGEENINEMNRRRKKDSHAKFGWTQYTDWTAAEFASKRGYQRSATSEEARSAIPVYAANSIELKSIDWRDTGKVTAVKNQGGCGSCWAFSAVETVESAALMANTPNDHTILSEQQVVSCDHYDGGCGGGDLIGAFQYIRSAGGLDSEQDYPYTSGRTGETGSCYDNHQYVSETKPTKWTYGTSPCQYGSCVGQDENALASSLMKNGPHGICLDASQWANYQGGVMTASQCGGSAANDLDHCVQLVGLKVSDGGDYWIVRNSWDTWFGDKGYIYLEKGTNTCGMANEALFVTL